MSDNDSELEDTPMEQALIWIGFDEEAEREQVMGAFGTELEDLLGVSEDDLMEEVKALGNRRSVEDRLHFGLKRAQMWRGVLHWVQDFDRVNASPDLSGSDQLSFRKDIEMSLGRAKIRKDTAKERQSRAQAAMPDKLKDEKSWDTWEAELLNMLNILRGSNGIQLAYIVREKEHEEGTLYDSFDEACIAKARLQGPHFEADAKQVHQIIMTLTIGENAEQWLKEVTKKANGRLDMAALRSHFRGAGNKSRRIAQATQMQKTLHYKNERALPFNVFISKVKKMFNIYDECEESVPETQKLRFLWDSIQDGGLGPTCEAIKASLNRDPKSWTFVDAADHIASQVSAVSKQSNLSSLGRANPTTEGPPRTGVMKNGKVFTGSYDRDAWNKLSKSEKDQVISARNGSTGNKKKPGKQIKALEKKLKEASKKLDQTSRQLSAVLGKRNAEDSDASSESSSGGANAGTQFGGQASRTSSTKKRQKDE